MKSPALALLSLLLVGCQLGGDPPLFELRSPEETGIAFANMLAEDDSAYNPMNFDYLYNGAGVAVGDLNGDGLQDLFFTGNMVSSRLYLNRGELHFDDVTEAAGVQTDVWATGVSLVDINQDGRLDVYVSVAGRGEEARRANLLFVNQGADAGGTPRFVEQARAYGIADTGYTTHSVFFDYDRDGDLDLYVLTNALEEFSRNLIRGKQLNGEAPSTDRLYRNDGNGTFSNVSREAGILAEGYGLGVAVSDINHDGWLDLYVANDFLTNDLVWINNRDGTFTDRAAKYLKHQSYNAMGTDIADYNNDGLVDIVVVDMLPEDNHRQKMMLGGSNFDAFHMGLSRGYQPQYVRNTLQLNNGPGPDGEPTFSEIGQLAGVYATDWSWAPLFADFDNDGLKDLFVSNGYRRDVTNLDYIVYNREGFQFGDFESRKKRQREALQALPEVKLHNYLFRNRGDLTFADYSERWGMEDAAFTNGAAYADLDGDGDLDLVTNNLDGAASLYENRSERLRDRNFLRVALRGPAGNPDGYGAQVTAYYGGKRQFVEQSPYRGYKSTVESVLHFGLGAEQRVDSLVIRWLDGTRQVLSGVEANRVLTLDHRDAAPAPAPAPRRRDLLFRSASTENGLVYAHDERFLADFKLTPLLPHKHSQGGPGLAVGDVDGNGLDDVFVGADRDRQRVIFLQSEPGRFVRRPLPADSAHEDMGALFFDADGDGDQDLYVVSGGSHPVEDGSSFYQDRLYLNDGRGGLSLARGALPEESASGSAVVAADYDRDGDLDLFVAGRVVPREYPRPARSFLLRNDTRRGGPPRFTDVTASVAPELAEAGLVSAALWSDYDRDGLVDLLVTGEWMPVRVFRSRGGKFEDATASAGLDQTHGWWNSLAAGDFDNDGDIDYVAGNLGLNSRYKASPREPVRVHAADFDQNGSFDPVISRYLGGKSYAVAPRDLLIDQMIPMKGRFPRYLDYANATLEQTLSPDERKQAMVAQSVNFANSYLENLGNGRFRVRSLPMRTQFAPGFGMLPGDHDGDGNLDLLVVGNSTATETMTGWYDASIGAVLLGDGAGRFRTLSGSESGFFVDGDAKGVAEVMLGGNRSLVLVTQNGGDLRVFEAKAADARRAVRLQPGDAYAVLTYADGRTRREEFYYGSTYLSQSSRGLTVPASVTRAEIFDFAGRSRTHHFR